MQGPCFITSILIFILLSLEPENECILGGKTTWLCSEAYIAVGDPFR
ncbi:hypothetical protein SAMN06298226_2897 [Nitrosovibrio sp. Nv4]|nr:hypothetical protein SAMN06298226_2897 [Nitrosovibrio sp. Nv4]